MEVKVTYKSGEVESFNGIDFEESEAGENFFNLVKETDEEDGSLKYQINLSEIRKIEWI